MSHCKAMIVTLGGQIKSPVKSIASQRPEFVVFFVSEWSIDRIQEVIDTLSEQQISFASDHVKADNPDDVLTCFLAGVKAVEYIRKNGFSNQEVMVDFTGATTPMSVGLSLAAVEHGFSFAYISGERDQKGFVKDGGESFEHGVNPWDFLGVAERHRASQFFNEYQFAAAAEIFRELASRAGDRSWVYTALNDISKGFHAWDLFRHKEADDCFNRTPFKKLLKDHDDEIRKIAVATVEAKDILQMIITSSTKSTIPCSELAHDLFANAERRFSSGMIDDAVLRLYRLVEMLAQMQLLNNYGIDASDIKLEQIPESIREKFSHDHYNDRSKKIKAPQYACYQLLQELNDPLGHLYWEHEDSFQTVRDSRNSSYLAHGFSSTQMKTYKRLRKFILSLNVINPAEAPRFPRIDL